MDTSIVRNKSIANDTRCADRQPKTAIVALPPFKRPIGKRLGALEIKAAKPSRKSGWTGMSCDAGKAIKPLTFASLNYFVSLQSI